MKIFKIMLTSLLLTLFTISIGFAAENNQATIRTDIVVLLDKQIQSFDNGHEGKIFPLVYNETTYLPVRSIAEMMGYDATWDSASQQVKFLAKHDSETLETSHLINDITLPLAVKSEQVIISVQPDITVSINSQEQIFDNGHDTTLFPIVYRDNIYVPVRWASHVLDQEINWDAFQKAIYIGEYLTDIRSVAPTLYAEQYYDILPVNYEITESDLYKYYLTREPNQTVYDLGDAAFPLLIGESADGKPDIVYDIYYSYDHNNIPFLHIIKNNCRTYPAQTPHGAPFTALDTNLRSVSVIFYSPSHDQMLSIGRLYGEDGGHGAIMLNSDLATCSSIENIFYFDDYF